MSGVEVIGILLGAIPLVVSAIKSYKTTKQRRKWFTKKDLYIDRLIQSLNEQIYFIKADVQIALRSTDLEQGKITAFLTDPDLDLLRNKEVADAIRDHLGEGFQLYLDALARCQDTTCNIVKNLNGLVSGTKSIGSADLAAIVRETPKKNGNFEFPKKIKFSLQKEDIEAEIAGLEASAKILGRINKQSTQRDTVAVQSSSQKITKLASTLALVRNSAHRLYTAISRGYKHTCHDQHEVQLFMQARSDLLDGRKSKSLKKVPVAFEVAFCLGEDMAWDQVVGSYKTEIQVTESYDDIDKSDICADSCMHRTQPVVTFNLPDPTDTTTSSVNVHNLCSLVHSTHANGESVEICLSRSGNLCSTKSPSKNNTVSPQTRETLCPVTLASLLTGADPNPPPLPLNHRIALSCNIASTVLQLHSTPWMTLPLASSSIFFIPDGSAKDHKTATQRNKYIPFIKAKFQSQPRVPTVSHYDPRESMLELGILLLELWYSHSIETFASENGFGLAQSFESRYAVARKWALHSEEEGDLMPFYLEAATRCIEFTFTTSSARPVWEDLAFQKSVCQDLLRPLLDHCPAKYR